jgi:excisionase family DNA binding protein
MPPTVLDHQPVTASEEDRPALIKLEDLFDHLEPESTSFQLVSTSGTAIDIPTPVFNLMHQMVTLLQGNSVTIVPIHKELTTQAAADILNVSRQYLVELLDNQIIPHTKVGTHRRIRFGDLMNYKNDRDAKRQAGLSRMTKKSQQLGLYTKAANTPEDPQGTQKRTISGSQ